MVKTLSHEHLRAQVKVEVSDKREVVGMIVSYNNIEKKARVLFEEKSDVYPYSKLTLHDTTASTEGDN